MIKKNAFVEVTTGENHMLKQSVDPEIEAAGVTYTS